MRKAAFLLDRDLRDKSLLSSADCFPRCSPKPSFATANFIVDKVLHGSIAETFSSSTHAFLTGNNRVLAKEQKNEEDEEARKTTKEQYLLRLVRTELLSR